MADSDPKTALRLLRVYLARRDADTLERLFQACHPLVLRIVELRQWRPAHREREVEDLVQDCLLDVLRGLERFAPGSPGAFRTWLTRIVDNNLHDHERHARAAKRGAGRVVRFSELQRGSLLLLIDGLPPPGTELGASELEESIARAMNALGEPHREALVLRKLRGLSHAEIAMRMGYASASSARSLCTRAMKKLRRQLALSSASTAPRKKA